MSQDRQGLMWFATNDGLNKYDGYHFTVYHNKRSDSNSIASEDIGCLFVDSRDRIWIGFNGMGTDIFDPVSNKVRHLGFNKSQGAGAGFVDYIQEDKSGAFWIKSQLGIKRIQLVNDAIQYETSIELDTSFQNMPLKSRALDFMIDSRNRKFVTTNHTVFEIIFDDSLRTYHLIERFHIVSGNPDFINALKEDTINHCYYLDDGVTVWKFPDYNFSKPKRIAINDHFTTNWTVDNNGNLWFRQHNDVIVINTRNGKSQKIIPDIPEHSTYLRSTTVLLTDQTGVIWIGLAGYGIFKYDPATSGFNHSLKGRHVYQLLEDKQGRVISSSLDALYLSEDSVNINLQYIRDSLVNPKLTMSFTMDTAGNFWFGGNRGIVEYNPLTKKSTSIEVPYKEYVTLPFPLFADNRSSIWMGYNNTLIRYNLITKSFSQFEYTVKDIPHQFDFLMSIYQEDHLLWLGTRIGLFCFDIDGEKFVRSFMSDQQDTTSISNNVALSFCADPDNPDRYLWIGTRGGGLNRLDKKSGTFTTLNADEGLANNVVYGIIPDYEGNLWLSTNLGISVFNIKRRQFTNYDVSDGLQSNEFNRYAYLRTSEGYIVFGGLDGINYFRSQEIHALSPPKVVFTNLKILNQTVIAGKPQSVLTRSIGYTDLLNLKYEQNVVSFEFAAMDYRKRGSIRYRYKLEGFDKDWVNAGLAHEATYTNLDPGDYKFFVQAKFENGSWGSEITNITLHIATPWYWSWWFISIVVIGVTGIAYLMYRFRQYQLKKIDRVRNKIARDLHDEVGASISSIAIYSKIVQDQVSKLDYNNEALIAKISDSASEIQGSMNDIVWNINTKNDDFQLIINRMRDHAMQLFEAKSAVVHFDFDEQLNKTKLGMEQRREFYLIFKEALNNIVKYADARNVWVSIGLYNSTINLKIRDDGKGFDKANTRKDGNGLQNMEQRATFLKGKIFIESVPGKGTSVTLSFAVSKM